MRVQITLTLKWSSRESTSTSSSLFAIPEYALSVESFHRRGGVDCTRMLGVRRDHCVQLRCLFRISRRAKIVTSLWWEDFDEFRSEAAISGDDMPRLGRLLWDVSLSFTFFVDFNVALGFSGISRPLSPLYRHLRPLIERAIRSLLCKKAFEVQSIFRPLNVSKPSVWLNKSLHVFIPKRLSLVELLKVRLGLY